MRSLLIFAAIGWLAAPATVYADAICRDLHIDKFGSGARGISSPAFLITEGCSPDPLRPQPRAPQLAIRWSEDRNGETAAEPLSPEASDPAPRPIPTDEPAPVTVLFDLDSATLTLPAAALLDGVGKGTRVSVTGHTCELGSSSRNLLLSQHRAETVAAYLRERGGLVQTVEGKGECCPVSDRLELNRRVEVIPTRKEE